MADGITINWITTTLGTTVLCDGPVRGVNKWVGPLQEGDATYQMMIDAQTGLRAPQKKFNPRGNGSVSFSFAVEKEHADFLQAFATYTLLGSTLPQQGNLQITMTQGGSQSVRFLNNACIESINRKLIGVSVRCTYRFLGGVFTTS